MDYNQITNFLDRFKKLLFKEEEIYKIISETINKHTSSEIESKSLKISGSVIYVKGSPMLRNEVFIHKEGILKDLAGFLPDRHFNDIR